MLVIQQTIAQKVIVPKVTSNLKLADCNFYGLSLYYKGAISIECDKNIWKNYSSNRLEIKGINKAGRFINENIMTIGDSFYKSDGTLIKSISDYAKILSISKDSFIVGSDYFKENHTLTKYDFNINKLWQVQAIDTNLTLKHYELKIINNENIILPVYETEAGLIVNLVRLSNKDGSFLWKKNIVPNYHFSVSADGNIVTKFGIFDSNGNKLQDIQLSKNVSIYNFLTDKHGNIVMFTRNGNRIVSIFDKNLNKISNFNTEWSRASVLSDNGIIYMRGSNRKKIIAINFKGIKLWSIKEETKKYIFLLDSKGVLHSENFSLQTSSKGLSRGGWPAEEHDLRRTNNINSPIYLKEYPNNNDHKKVICEIDNKTIDINKLTHLNKGWHLLGNSYETKDYCPFSNIDYVYYYDTPNSKFNKININNESTHKVIPKHSGLFIYNKYDDDLTIYYDKEEILEKDKNIIDKEYINTLSNGWHLLGSSDGINDISIFEDVKGVYIYDNAKGYTLLDSKSESNSIKEYSGFWVHK